MKINLNNKKTRALMLFPSSILMIITAVFSILSGSKIELFLLYCLFCSITISNYVVISLNDIKEKSKL